MKIRRLLTSVALLALGFACGESASSDRGSGGDAGVGAGLNAGSSALAGSSASSGAAAVQGGSAQAGGVAGATSVSGSVHDAGAGVGGDAAAGGESCQPRLAVALPCPDLIGAGVLARASVTAEDGASSLLSEVEGGLRLVTESGFLVTVRLAFDGFPDAQESSVLRLHLRATNTNTGWQGNVPLLTLEDQGGKRRSYAPGAALYPKDGTTWIELRVPLAGGKGWQASGDALDLAKLAALELTADTWEAGFTIDFDKLGFVAPGTTCAAQCPTDCSGRGRCSPEKLGCVCEVGAIGPACATCATGFVLEGGQCRLVNDANFDYWPNAVSKTNGDAWLQAHHQDIRTLRPRLLALNFANPGAPDEVETLLSDVVAGFREGSRPLGAEDASAQPGLDYELLDVIDLRDGVAGRPPAPADYAFENSTLYPRRPQGEQGSWGLDYAALFSEAFAPRFGFEDPDAPGSYLDLCELVESGRIHELWLVGSGDVPDASAAEVLEHKQRYDAGRNPIPDNFERCAGNGCFDLDVPRCARSLRIGFVNYNRGPGCYLHSQGHGLESTARQQISEALSEWFLPLAGFDLDARYGLAGQSFYELLGEQDHAEYPAPSELDVVRGGSTTHVDGYVASCGNVHFPPNAGNHYDYASTVPVSSDCRDFGRNVATCRARTSAAVSAAMWANYEQLSPDCGGAFLVYWYQHMPGFGSGQLFDDGRPMLSVWPFLFY